MYKPTVDELKSGLIQYDLKSGAVVATVAVAVAVAGLGFELRLQILGFGFGPYLTRIRHTNGIMFKFMHPPSE
jgi:hypothetical protein